MTTELTIRRPDDWHLHLRDGAMLEGVIGDTSRHFARANVRCDFRPGPARFIRNRAIRAYAGRASPRTVGISSLTVGWILTPCSTAVAVSPA